MATRLAEPRVAVVDGHRVAVFERRPPLPLTLSGLVAELRITFRAPLTISGWRTECGREEHRYIRVLEGRHLGRDHEWRSLRLFQCRDCEGIEVHDVTFDVLDDAPVSRLPLRRRDHLLAHYSGARKAQRVYG